MPRNLRPLSLQTAWPQWLGSAARALSGRGARAPVIANRERASAPSRPALPLRALRKPVAARAVMRLMEQLRHGRLEVHWPDGSIGHYGQKNELGGSEGATQAGFDQSVGEGGAPADTNSPPENATDLPLAPSARVDLANWNVCGAALKKGDIGFAETYLDCDWRTDDLAALLDIMVRNRTAIEAVVYGSWWGRLVSRMRRLGRANTKAGSRRNVEAHYDLGNDFYSLWLDPTMTYSSALFDKRDAAQPAQSLAQAQVAKYRRLLEELAITGSDPSVLEIGCGWGEPVSRQNRTVAQWREFALKSDPNDFDSDGHTALIAATQAGNHNAVEAILPLTCMDAKDHHHGLRAWEWAWEHATGLDDWRLLDLMAAHPASVDWRHEVLHLTQNGQIAPENLPRTLAQEEARVLREEITEAGLASTTDNEGTGVPSPAPHAAQATRPL